MSRRTNQPTKSVSFSSDISVEEVPVLANTRNEKRALYYSKKDYVDFKHRDSRTIQRMEVCPSSPMKTSRKCSRGLEGRTSGGRRKSLLLRIDSQMAVFDEQEIMMENGKSLLPEAIALAYQDCTKQAIQDAQELAKLDADDAAKYMKEQSNRRTRRGLQKQLSKLFANQRKITRRSNAKTLAGKAA